MDEARRFLRYITPGFTFIIQVCLFLYISNRQGFFDIVENLIKLGNVGLLIAALIASGGLGYIFSVIHHFICWRFYARFLPKCFIDHRELLQNAETSKLLELRSQKGDVVQAKNLSVDGAWRVITALWHERKDASGRLRGADHRTTSLCDVMHGSGTAVVACIGAILFWLLIHRTEFSIWPSEVWSWVTAILLLIIHFFNYRMMVKHSQGVIDIVFSDDLLYPPKGYSRPAVAVVSTGELNDKT